MNLYIFIFICFVATAFLLVSLMARIQDLKHEIHRIPTGVVVSQPQVDRGGPDPSEDSGTYLEHNGGRVFIMQGPPIGELKIIELAGGQRTEVGYVVDVSLAPAGIVVWKECVPRSPYGTIDLLSVPGAMRILNVTEVNYHESVDGIVAFAQNVDYRLLQQENSIEWISQRQPIPGNTYLVSYLVRISSHSPSGLSPQANGRPSRMFLVD